MKESKKYWCKFCGAEFESQADADACEQGHVKPVKVKSLHYDAPGWPVEVCAVMSDNVTVAFRRRLNMKPLDNFRQKLEKSSPVCSGLDDNAKNGAWSNKPFSPLEQCRCPVGVTGLKYRDRDGNFRRWPVAITFEMDDGRSVTYCRNA